jgi:hypothetical protein
MRNEETLRTLIKSFLVERQYARFGETSKIKVQRKYLKSDGELRKEKNEIDNKKPKQTLITDRDSFN